ncbi:QacE family quaternary ammonium compound efflux SMR transporter [Mycetocola tolaasinivorans]|uniref:QacE family quaternary ammonium compound efflux SMR transporter n=1 Tax=Mycetocola tolaasinivorans TaxID=76635 RepID=A0A3L7A5F2_9MICO|nr:SMR family transporter [Mycetocola tolaasinivorans]RLP75080.1 QacE family quaternary ammonium compound efflux SMR transporter [Mycetocola tolaasinivorans]
MAGVLLGLAVLSEVAATASLRAAVDGSRRWYILVVGGYLTAFSLFAASLSAGMPLGVGYGIWAASGVAITAVLAKFLFKEALTPLMSLGIVLIIGGVVLVEVGSATAHVALG